jgi:hypothetical protein
VAAGRAAGVLCAHRQLRGHPSGCSPTPTRRRRRFWRRPTSPSPSSCTRSPPAGPLRGDVEFANVRVDDRTLLADATVVDTAGEDAICGEAITHSGALLRVTADPLPESLRVTVTDGWDTSAELTGQERVRDPAALDGSVRPDGEPPGVPAALDCPEESFERHPARYDGGVNWGSGGGIDRDSGLELRVVATERDGSTDASGGLRLERGDAFRVELTNVSRRPVGIGNEGKYNLEVDTEAGWTDVRGAADGRFAYTDELIPVRPGAVVEWSFELSEAGLVANHSSGDLRVCPALEPGRYRFVFCGADDIAVAFDYVGWAPRSSSPARGRICLRRREPDHSDP